MRPDFWYILIRVISVMVIVIAVARSSGMFAERPTPPDKKTRGVFHGIH